MKDEDRKILTEFLGERWEESYRIDHGQDYSFKGYDYQFETVDQNRTFDTWEDFGALWDAVIESNRLLDFLDEVNVPDDEIYDMRSGVGELLKHIIDIDRFPFLVSKAIKEGVIK